MRPNVDPKWPKHLIELMESCWHENNQERPTAQQIVSKLDEFKNGSNLKQQAPKRRISSVMRKSNLSRLL